MPSLRNHIGYNPDNGVDRDKYCENETKYRIIFFVVIDTNTRNTTHPENEEHEYQESYHERADEAEIIVKRFKHILANLSLPFRLRLLPFE